MPQLLVTFFRKRAKPSSVGPQENATKQVSQSSAIKEGASGSAAQAGQNESSNGSPSVHQNSNQLPTLVESKDQSHQSSKSAALEPEMPHVLQETSSEEPQNRLTPGGNESKSVAVRTTYSPTFTFGLNDDQKMIVKEFATILETIGCSKLSTTNLRDPNKQVLASLSPSFTPLAYNPDIFQSFYSQKGDLDPNSNTPKWNLKVIREQEIIRNFESKHHLELILDLFTLHSNPTNSHPSSGLRPFKLALFDMDSTLINEEVIDELARSIGVYDQVSAITHRAMNDHTFDFAASLCARVALLKGVPADIWNSLRSKVTIAAGARKLIAGLKENGVVTGVISGGFTPMAEWLKGELGLDLAFANHLSVSPPNAEYDHPHLTGKLDLTEGKVIVTPDYKRDTLIAEAERRGIPMEQTLAVGDGSNDLKMLATAGLGVAWNAKPRTQEMAPMRLNGESLEELLFLMGPARGFGM